MRDFIEKDSDLEILDYISSEIRAHRGEVFLTLKDDSEEAQEWIDWKGYGNTNYPNCWVYFEVKPKNIERIIAFFKELIDEELDEYKNSKEYQKYQEKIKNMEKKE